MLGNISMLAENINVYNHIEWTKKKWIDKTSKILDLYVLKYHNSQT